MESEWVDPADAIDPLVLSLDVGSSSARALVYDGKGQRVRGWEVHRPFSLLTSPDGGVVIDAESLADLTEQCLDEILLACAGTRPLAAVACDTFWHSVMGVDRRARALTPVFTWADTRSRDQAIRLSQRLDAADVHARTGCVLHSSYWPAKISWLVDTQPELVRTIHQWLSFGEYLYLRFFGEGRVSISMASATGLFDQHTCEWDRELLGTIGLDESKLSPIREFSEVLSGLRAPFSMRWPSLQSVPWFLPVGDGGCNNIGSGGVGSDWLVAMVGTSGAIRVIREGVHFEIPPEVWSYRIDRKRCVQGGALSDGGNVFAWLAQTLQLPPPARLEEELAAMPPDAHGLTMLPFFAGERSPNWHPHAEAAVRGMTLATRPVDIVRASLEAVAYRFGIVYGALRGVIPKPRGIIGSGAGLIHSPAWLQIMSDVLGEPIFVSAVPEASSRGAALLVLESIGAVPDLNGLPAPFGRQYMPTESHTEIYRSAMSRQQGLYRLLIEE